MAEPEEFYTPASIDKQVDALLSGDTMPIHDQHLAHDLRAFLAPENEDVRSLERVFTRFQEYQRAEHRQQGTVLPFPESLGQPELAGHVRAIERERLERGRPDALDVPAVEELVRDGVELA